MTITLAPDDRTVPRVATLASRHGSGRVIYPPEFRRLAHPSVGRNSGASTTSYSEARTAAGDPAVPLSVYSHRVKIILAHVLVYAFCAFAGAVIAAWWLL